MKYRPEIEGLRAVAVLLVVLSHLGVTGFSGGFVGVDVFFVISGYLITGLISSEYAKRADANGDRGWFSLRSFYFRRVKRIVPMSFTILVATTFASYILFNAIRAKTVLVDSIWAALFSANIHFINISTNYFQQGYSTSPLQHYWSLAVEEQFYLVVPALFVFAVKLKDMKFFVVQLGWERRIKLLYSLIVIASLSWSVIETYSNPSSAYFSSLTRAWELGAGALLAISTLRGAPRIPPRLNSLESIFGLGLIGFSTLIYTSTTNFPGFVAIAPVLGASMIIHAGISGTNFVSKILSSKPFTGIGKISYSLYLWHWPLIVILNATHPRILKSVIGQITLIFVAITLSVLSYKLIEQPFRRIPIPSRWSREKLNNSISVWYSRMANIRKYRAAAVSLLLVISLLSGISIFYTNHVGKKSPTTKVTQPSITPSTSPNPTLTRIPSLSYDATLQKWDQLIFNSLLIFNARNLKPTFAKTQSYDTWRNPDCNHVSSIFGVAEIKNLAICRAGFGSKTALFIGNSHGRMLQKAVTDPFVKAGWTIYSFFMPWCMTLDVNGIDKTFSKIYDCNLYHQDIQLLLAKMHPDVVIESDRLFPKATFIAAGKTYAANSNEPLFWKIYLDSLKTIRAQTKQLIVIGITPELPKPIIDCADAQLNLEVTCQASGANISGEVSSQSQAANLAQALFIDTRDWLCYKKIFCPAVIGQTLVYKDADHTSFPMEPKLALLFSAYLKQNNIF